jgi:hypothetical protein
VCGLGAVGASLVFGLVRGTGAFAAVLPSVVLVSRIQLARASAFRVGLGVSGVTIVSGSCARPSISRIPHLLTSTLSLGISSLYCCATQCM